MKKLAILYLIITDIMQLNAQQTIRISTDETDLILKTNPQTDRLCQSYLGKKFNNGADIEKLPFFIARPSSDAAVTPRGWEAYSASGWEDYFEPAFAIQHNDGNLTSILRYVSLSQNSIDNNVQETVINLKDDVYPVEAKLHYMAYKKENILKT